MQPSSRIMQPTRKAFVIFVSISSDPRNIVMGTPYVHELVFGSTQNKLPIIATTKSKKE